MATQTRKLTYAEYALFPSDGKRYQVIDGDLYVSPSPIDRHQVAVANIAFKLRQHVQGAALGRVRLAPLDVLLDQYTIVQPDVFFVSWDRQGILTGKNVQGAPDLIVEVLSPSTAEVDRGVKAQAYARAGVREYWLADPEAGTLEVLLRGEGESYRRHSFSGSPDTVAGSSILPGFALTPREAFEE